jgi:DNA-binding transcriptional regulator YhcF (GntR family)
MHEKFIGAPLRLSDAVRKTLAQARKEAARLRHDHVGPEHLLIAATRERSVASELHRLGVAPEQVRAAVEARVSAGVEPVAPRRLEYSDQAKKVLEYAAAEVRASGSPVGRMGHLVLGLLREESGIASLVLNELGITLDRVRSLQANDQREQDRRFRLRIDDASDRSIYEQIVGQITEAVATGALRPGERLPTVRQLADDLDIAPGTVAKAYGELERQGFVVTQGARGTRVADRGAAPADGERMQTLAGLLRPVAVAAFHLGADAQDLRVALEAAMQGIFDRERSAA